MSSHLFYTQVKCVTEMWVSHSRQVGYWGQSGVMPWRLRLVTSLQKKRKTWGWEIMPSRGYDQAIWTML